MEPENTEVGTEEPGSSPEPAQPTTPSTEAGQVAAAEGPTEEPAKTEVDWDGRLKGLQSSFDKRLNKAGELARLEKERADALQAQVDAERLKGMTQEEQIEYRAELAQRKLEEQRLDLAERQAQVEGKGVYYDWFSYWVSEGVPAERLQQCEDLGQLQAAATGYWKDMAIAAAKTAVPAEPAPPPAVVPGDQVHGGTAGAPPGREWDKYSDGYGAGTKEFNEFLKKQGNATELQ